MTGDGLLVVPAVPAVPAMPAVHLLGTSHVPFETGH